MEQVLCCDKASHSSRMYESEFYVGELAVLVVHFCQPKHSHSHLEVGLVSNFLMNPEHDHEVLPPKKGALQMLALAQRSKHL